MNQPLPLELTALAVRQVQDAEDWWRKNRQAAPNAVRDELERAFALISLRPSAGSRASDLELADVRRVFLAKIKYQLYYRVLPNPKRVQVVALWHARRGKGPPL